MYCLTLTSVMCSKNFCPFIYLFWVTLNSFWLCWVFAARWKLLYEAGTQAVQKWATSCDHRESGIVMQMFIFPYKWWLEARYKVKYLKCIYLMGFPGGSNGKKSACNAGDLGLIPGLGRSPLRGYYSCQYSCLENSMDRGPWWATVHGVVKRRTWLRD